MRRLGVTNLRALGRLSWDGEKVGGRLGEGNQNNDFLEIGLKRCQMSILIVGRSHTLRCFFNTFAIDPSLAPSRPSATVQVL